MDTNNSSGLAAKKKFHQYHKGHLQHAGADKNSAERLGHGLRKKRHHHDKTIATMDTGNLNRASGQRTTHDMVQNWLTQSTIADQNYPTVFEDDVGPTDTHHYHHLREQRQSRPLPRDTRSSALPRPPNPPLVAGTRLRSPPQVYERPPNFHKRALSDSSILSVDKNQRTSPKDRYGASHHASAFHGLAPAELSRKLEVNVEGFDSDKSASPVPAYRSKRPRNKTRDDKYEHKKESHRSRKPVEDGPPPKSSKRRKEAKKRAMTSSKNVMNNWTSKAVLNDRITQPIKPGIFQNSREANKQPAQDLVFSDMHFLQDRKSSTKPKPLSERRLRELEKQHREIKEVSSFFLPVEAPDQIPDIDVGHQRGRDQEAFRKVYERPASSTQRHSASKSSQSEPSGSQEFPLDEQRLQRYRDSHLEVSDDFSVQGVEGGRISKDNNHRPISSRSSRPTTYISWPTSPSRSPFPTVESVSQDSSGIQNRRTTTPETIRRALVDSGIFRGTGIAAYDQECISPDPTANSDEEQGGTESHRSEELPAEVDLERREILQRLEILLPTAWRVDHSQADQALPSKPQLSKGDSSSAREHIEKPRKLHSTLGNARKDIADSARIKVRNERDVQEKSDERQNPQCRSHLDEDINNHAACPIGSNNDDEISTTSRDLMPPPPLPNKTSRPRPSGAVQKPSATGPDTRYYPTDKELSSAARVMAQHDTIHRGVDSFPAKETDHESLTGSSSRYGIAPLQSASWVTPSSKPPTPTLTTNTNISRLSSTSPSSYDVDHSAARGPFPTRTQVRAAQPQESIAEFIARIEREADVLPQTPMNERQRSCKVVSPRPDARIVGADMEVDTADFGDVFDDDMDSSSTALHENQSLHPPSDRVSYWKDNEQFATRDIEETAHLTDYECPRSESIYPGSTEDALQLSGLLNHRVLNDKEGYEMTSFWGPNNFIQF